ncbi:MAG: PH domain-containing protein [Pseudonocardiaceae bacterium]
MEDLRADIAAAAARMSVKIGSKREIRKLVEHLWEGEGVQRMTSGVYGSGMGLVVLTDRRLFFLKDGWMSQTSEDFPLERVSSIQWSAGVIQGSIVVFASGNKAEIKNVAKSDGKDIVDLVRAQLSGQTAARQLIQQTAIHTPPAQPSDSSPRYQASDKTITDPDTIIRQLRQLGELRDAGVVTPEEFNSKKAELLARL